MIPDEVCHYTKKKKALIIIASEKLRISQLKSTNDPRESKARNFPVVYRADLSTSNDPKRDKKITELNNSSNKIASQKWKALCVTLHRPEKEIDASESNSRENFLKKVYNQTLRQGYSHPRMWAQYAENHHGVCLIFNGVSLNRNLHSALGDQCKIFQGSVKYDYKSLTPSAPFSDISLLQ